ncbi:manganese catalase family protein [Calderihabitans maritimus]|uniref:Manganese-containing, non-heme catalase n=1 Tax=Calderihabitans maritimus TaxID=1246530 RepID=A0A1Z5HU97_9FIRM|nr:manganese catalase family protein [Calderihabitans maritimus]GAW93106.1 manganese-containing, non-heme catalase [Calderihabitans maritimus]
MWVYEKKLQYPVRVSKCDVRMAKYLITQYGGPDGELSAALRYLNQRYTMPTGRAKALLTDIGTEELAHLEIIATMVYKLLKGVPPEKLKEAGLGAHYAQHDSALFLSDANGVPWTAAYIQAHGDPVADLHEDMAAEQKARATYEHLIRLTDDPDLKDGLRFLREREVVHFQRFGEALDHVQGYLNDKKFY